MLKIRLRRMGSRHRPFYRVVVGDSRRTPKASALEELGYYDPRKKPAVLNIDVARADHWVGHGARPSPTVERLIEQARKGPVEPAAEAEIAEAAEAEAPAAKAPEKAEAPAAKAPEKAEAPEAEAKAPPAAEPEAEAAAPEAPAAPAAEADAEADAPAAPAAEAEAPAEPAAETEKK